MPKIFLSYRREDSAGVAGRIYDRLRDHFPNDEVVMDIVSIPFGVDFREYINTEVARCDVLLAVIGPRWLGVAGDSRRLDDPRDFVRIEIEAALQRDIPVIPVLIDRIGMPTEADLPPSLSRLAYRNAIEVDQGRDFHPHVDRLIKGIERHFRNAEVSTPVSVGSEGATLAQVTQQPEPVPSSHPLPAHDGKPLRVETNPFCTTAPERSNIRWLWACLAGLLVLAMLGFAIYKVTNKPPFPAPDVASGGSKSNSSTAAAKANKSTPTEELKTTPSPPKKELINSLGMTLVRIESGSFLMGSTKEQIEQLMRLFPESRRGWFDEQPQHPVQITRPFFLGIHPVTQGQYQAVMGNNPSHFKGSDDLPAESVSWLDAVLFCNKLSEQEKKTPFYRINKTPFYRINGTEVTIAGGNGYRLPTEAEWEYACRAGSATLYSFGDDEMLVRTHGILFNIEAGELGDHAWYDDNSGHKTHPVGQKLPNAWGLYDMLGNVGEWCQDWYEAGYYRASPPADPPGPSETSYRVVVRGGSWGDFHGICRPANRDGRTPESRGDDLGFRVAAFQE